MNPSNQNDGQPTTEIPTKKHRGCPPGGWPNKRKKILEPNKDGTLPIGGDERDIEANLSLRLSMTVPEGPYGTQAERWNAYRKILDLQAVRDKLGKKGISEAKIGAHVGVPYQEFEREIYSNAFQNFRLAKASMQIMGALADIAPALRLTLLDLSEEMMVRGKGHDPKKQREFVALVSNVMEKFGIQKIDTSNADASSELDTDEAIEEGMRIVNELKGREEVVQWFTKSATEPRGNQGKALEIKPDSGTPENHSNDGPNQPVEAV